MHRLTFISTIITLLSSLQSRIEISNSLNLNDINVHAEDFFREFLNQLYGYQLVNMNILEGNFPAIDLGDATSQIAIQVTSRTDLDKVRKTVTAFGAKKLNGNNVAFSGEIARRLVMVRLDAGLIDPTQERSYRLPDLKRWVKQNRAALVSAILTIIQAWIAAGRPSAEKRRRLASFEDWSAVTGDILSFAGIDGFLNDRETIKGGISDETDAVQLLIQHMYRSFSTNQVRIGRLNWDDSSRSADLTSEFLDEAFPKSLVHLVLDHADSLSFWWLSEAKEKWGGRIGRELSQHLDRVFEVSTDAGTVRVKLRKARNEKGVVYFLKLVGKKVATPIATVQSSDDDDGDDASGLDKYVRRDPVVCPKPAGLMSECAADPASETMH